MRYRAISGGRRTLSAVMVLFAVVMIMLLSAVGLGDVPVRPWFLAAWVVTFVAAMPWSLWIVACELQLVDNFLRAEYVLRRRDIPIDRIVSIRSLKWAADIAVVDIDGGRPVLVWAARKGFRAFTEAIVQRRPAVRVRLGWYVRMADRVPGPSGLRR